MTREKVPSVKWIGGGLRQKGRFWVATFANEGAEYINTLRSEYRRMKADSAYTAKELAEVVEIGKHAIAVYNRHFGEI